MKKRGQRAGRKKNIRKTLSLLLIVLGLGFSMLPALSFSWTKAAQEDSVRSMLQTPQKSDVQKLEAIDQNARRYNQALAQDLDGVFPSREQDGYEEQLDWNGNSIMGSISIPKIGVHLPIYPRASAQSMASGAGHVEWSSLPCGGKGSHCLLSSHRGMASAMLFTRLDELEEGDLFLIENPLETLAYRVCDIQVVEPSKTEKLKIDPEEDRVTLITCTPFGINSRRLLVSGMRTEYTQDMEEERQSASPMLSVSSPVSRLFLLVPAALFGLVGLVFLARFFAHRKRR